MKLDDDEELAIYINKLHTIISERYPDITKKQVRFIIYAILTSNDVEKKIKLCINEYNLKNEFNKHILKI